MSTVIPASDNIPYPTDLHKAYMKLNSKQKMIYENLSDDVTKVSYLAGILEERRKWVYFAYKTYFII